MCRTPRIAVNADERTARRSVPATFVGCVGRKPGEGELNGAIANGTSPSPRFARPSQREGD